MARVSVFCCAVLLLLSLFSVTAPAAAETYLVKLQDGSVIESRYQPQEASWDSNLVLLLTEMGNWIGVPKSLIVGVSNETTDRGFGFVINTTTIALGWAPNDLPLEGDAEKVDPQTAALQALYNLRAKEQSYSIQQFVEPGQTQGIPAGLISPLANP